jgi:hypothetical protein
LLSRYWLWCARNSRGRYSLRATGPSLTAATPSDDVAGAQSRRTDRVAANARLTGTTAAVLFVLLAAEGVTILRISRLLRPHVVLGMVLVPVVALKVVSVSYRFIRYYQHAPDFRAKGPPPIVLRVLGPLLVVLTVAVFASGIALIFVGQVSILGQRLLLAHKASFIGWIAVLAVHVLGHLRETAHLAPQDWLLRTRRQVAGASRRQWAVTASLCAGTLLGFALLPQLTVYMRG